MEINNLNDRYTLLSYDINLMKNTIKTINVDDLLNTCPHFILSPNTLLYHFSDTKGKINKKLQTDDLQYDLNFLGHYNKHKDLTHCQVLWNNKALKLLDLTLLSIELGFNPTMFYINDRLKNTSSKIIDYCQNNNIDGYMTYNVKNLVIEGYDEESATYIKDVQLSSLSPTIVLVNNNLKVLSDIALTKSERLMKKSELIKLHNVVFCSLLNIMSITLGDDVIVDLSLNTNLLLDTNLTAGKSITLYGTNEYTLDEFFNIVEPHLLSLLTIDSSNLSDDCQFDYYKNINLIYPTMIENLKADIIINLDIQSHFSDALFDIALRLIAEQFNLTPFIYANYKKLNQMMIFIKYNMDFIRGKNIEEMKNIFNDIEKIIFNQLFLIYKNTSKGTRGNIAFINLEYIKTTYQFIKNHIMGILIQIPFEKFVSLMGGQINKNIVNYFNVNYLYHQIIGQKYEKPKLLYQDLLNDVTKYKQLPSINLRYLKIISNLSNDTQLTIFLENTTLGIYDFYKSYIAGEKLFVDLYQFLGIDPILEYLKTFATINHLNPSIVIGYNDLSLMDQMEKYSVYTLYDEMKTDNDIAFYKSKLELMESKILVVKFLNVLLRVLNVNIDNTDLRTFLLYHVEKIINENVNIKNLINNNEANWYDIAKVSNDQENEQLIQLFLQNNNNEELISYIYNYLDQDLLPKTKQEILLLIKQKNLLQIWLSYLNGEINKETLSKIVFTDFSVLSKQQSTRREKERSHREEEGEERTQKSKSKKIQRDEKEEQEQIDRKTAETQEKKEQLEKELQEQKEAEREARRERRRLEKEETERLEQEEKKEQLEKELQEQKEAEREARRERRQLEKEETERLEKEIEREARREQRRLEKEQKEIEAEERRQAKEFEKERARKIAIENEDEDSNYESEETQSM